MMKQEQRAAIMIQHLFGAVNGALRIKLNFGNLPILRMIVFSMMVIKDNLLHLAQAFWAQVGQYFS